MKTSEKIKEAIRLLPFPSNPYTVAAIEKIKNRIKELESGVCEPTFTASEVRDGVVAELNRLLAALELEQKPVCEICKRSGRYNEEVFNSKTCLNIPTKKQGGNLVCDIERKTWGGTTTGYSSTITTGTTGTTGYSSAEKTVECYKELLADETKKVKEQAATITDLKIEIKRLEDILNIRKKYIEAIEALNARYKDALEEILENHSVPHKMRNPLKRKTTEIAQQALTK